MAVGERGAVVGGEEELGEVAVLGEADGEGDGGDAVVGGLKEVGGALEAVAV